MTITLQAGQFDTYRISTDDGRDIYIQSDTDFPAIAATFGWTPCHCGSTDDTVDCEHRTAIEMIADARRYLDDHLGESVADVGYF